MAIIEPTELPGTIGFAFGRSAPDVSVSFEEVMIMKTVIMSRYSSSPFRAVSGGAGIAQGNDRGAIDRKWQQVRAWQERQDKKFKAIEREGEHPSRKMDGSKGPLPIIH